MKVFRPGQRVRCINASNTIYLKYDNVYTIESYYDDVSVFVRLVELPRQECSYSQHRFELAEPQTFDEFLDMTPVECK